MTSNAKAVPEEIYGRFLHAGGDPSKTANPTIEIRTADLATALRDSMSKDDVANALEELAKQSCLIGHMPGHFTLTPVGVLRGKP
jgi:hypothetical protein